jgi:type III restriction enzyme
MGYRLDLGSEELKAKFDENSTLELTPEVTGASAVLNSGIIGERAEMNLEHLSDTRFSSIVAHLTSYILTEKYRDEDGNVKLHLFGSLKKIVSFWLQNHLECKGGTYPSQLIYRQLADRAAERIIAGISNALINEKKVRVQLNPYNKEGSTDHIHFLTRKEVYTTDIHKSPVNHIVLDSGWEGEFARVLESMKEIKSYVKNQGLNFEIPYRKNDEIHRYYPDFVLLVDDGHDDPLHLIAEVKGFKNEDVKDKENAVNHFWIPGVNAHGGFGRWAFVQLEDVYSMKGGLFEKINHEKVMAAISAASAGIV